MIQHHFTTDVIPADMLSEGNRRAYYSELTNPDLDKVAFSETLLNMSDLLRAVHRAQQ